MQHTTGISVSLLLCKVSTSMTCVKHNLYHQFCPQPISGKLDRNLIRFTTSLHADFWEIQIFWDLEIQTFGIQKMQKIKNPKIQICSAQNVGKVWISRKKSSRPYLGPSEAIFSMDRKNQKNDKILPIFLGGPMGPYSPGLGPCCYPPEVGVRCRLLSCFGAVTKTFHRHVREEITQTDVTSSYLWLICRCRI